MMREVVGGDAGGVIPAYGLDQKLVEGPTAGMLAEVEKRYRAREAFAFVAWEPHWMNEAYDLDYLEDPKGALGNLTEPSDVSTLVREGLAEDDPTAYAFLEALSLDEGQINDLEAEIIATGSADPEEGVRNWLEDHRSIVEPWVTVAREAQEG